MAAQTEDKTRAPLETATQIHELSLYSDLVDETLIGRRKSRKKHKKHKSHKHRPGTAPGTLHADPTARATQIRITRYSPESVEEIVDVAVEDIVDLMAEDSVLWVDVSGLADIETVRTLGRAFELHELALEDVLDVSQRPKAEPYESTVFIVTRMHVKGGLETEQISLFLGQGFLLTFQERVDDSFDLVRERLRRSSGRMRSLGADYLAYALLDAVIDGYFPVLERLGEEIEALEDQVIKKPDPEMIDELYRLKRDLLGLRRAIWPTREVVNALIRDESTHLSSATRLHLRDCYDHSIQLMDILETYREISSGLLDVYLSCVSTRMNEVMKVLTIIATIFIPLSFITGLYGMNFDPGDSPWNMPELEWHFGYPYALGLMLLVAGSLMVFFWRRGWLGKV